MNILQNKLDFLLKKYDVFVNAKIESNGLSVQINEKEYALLPWRYERRFIELKKIVDSKTVGEISHFKIMSLNSKETSADFVLKRELDIAEFISGQRIVEIFMAENGKTQSVLCLTDKKAVITLELASTLKNDAETVDKHEIITDRGTTCDRNVDSQTPLSSIYVYGEKTTEYTDVDFELYGLKNNEITAVRAAFSIAKDEQTGANNNAISKRLDELIKAAHTSAEKCKNVILGGQKL